MKTIEKPNSMMPTENEQEEGTYTPFCGDCRNYNVCELAKRFHAGEREKLHHTYSRAIREDQMEMYVQFVYNTKKDALTGVEVLSRWNHPEKGLLSPASYIKGMNFVGISDELDYCMLEKSCRLMEHWKREGYGDFGLSCNFTRATISQEDFAERVGDILSRYDINRSRLSLEMTEDTVMRDPETARANMQRCHELGISFALDDLGAGYSSLRDLCDFPFDAVKIDRCMTQRSHTEKGRTVLRDVIRMAHDMGMETLCEGVETEEQSRTVIDAGCDYIQGFYYSRVYPVSEARKFYMENWMNR